MELQDFICSVLVQVVRGVEHAQSELRDSKATINPLGIRSQIALNQNKESPEFSNVEFEVAVEVKSQGVQSGGGGIHVAVFKMGIEGKRLEAESHLSKLRFSVPVHLPPGAVIKDL